MKQRAQRNKSAQEQNKQTATTRRGTKAEIPGVGFYQTPLLAQKASGLLLPHGGINTVLFQELLVGTLLGNDTALQHNKTIHGGNGGKPVGDGDYRLSLHNALEILFHNVLDF